MLCRAESGAREQPHSPRQPAPPCTGQALQPWPRTCHHSVLRVLLWVAQLGLLLAWDQAGWGGGLCREGVASAQGRASRRPAGEEGVPRWWEGLLGVVSALPPRSRDIDNCHPSSRPEEWGRGAGEALSCLQPPRPCFTPTTRACGQQAGTSSPSASLAFCFAGQPPGPSCPLGPALTRIAGTRVMVGVGASFLAAPDGGPGFLAAETGLVRREGRRGEPAAQQPGPSWTPPPSREGSPGIHWKAAACPDG